MQKIDLSLVSDDAVSKSAEMIVYYRNQSWFAKTNEHQDDSFIKTEQVKAIAYGLTSLSNKNLYINNSFLYQIADKDLHLLYNVFDKLLTNKNNIFFWNLVERINKFDESVNEEFYFKVNQLLADYILTHKQNILFENNYVIDREFSHNYKLSDIVHEATKQIISEIIKINICNENIFNIWKLLFLCNSNNKDDYKTIINEIVFCIFNNNFDADYNNYNQTKNYNKNKLLLLEKLFKIVGNVIDSDFSIFSLFDNKLFLNQIKTLEELDFCRDVLLLLKSNIDKQNLNNEFVSLNNLINKLHKQFSICEKLFEYIEQLQKISIPFSPKSNLTQRKELVREIQNLVLQIKDYFPSLFPILTIGTYCYDKNTYYKSKLYGINLEYFLNIKEIDYLSPIDITTFDFFWNFFNYKSCHKDIHDYIYHVANSYDLDSCINKFRNVAVKLWVSIQKSEQHDNNIEDNNSQNCLPLIFNDGRYCVLCHLATFITANIKKKLFNNRYKQYRFDNIYKDTLLIIEFLFHNCSDKLTKEDIRDCLTELDIEPEDVIYNNDGTYNTTTKASVLNMMIVELFEESLCND